MEEVKSRGPYIYSVLESAQAFLSQHPFEELEDTASESKGLWISPFLALPCHSSSWAGPERMEWRWYAQSGMSVLCLMSSYAMLFPTTDVLWCSVLECSRELLPLKRERADRGLGGCWMHRGGIPLSSFPWIFRFPFSLLSFNLLPILLWTGLLFLLSISLLLCLHRCVSPAPYPKHQPLCLEAGKCGQ